MLSSLSSPSSSPSLSPPSSLLSSISSKIFRSKSDPNITTPNFNTNPFEGELFKFKHKKKYYFNLYTTRSYSTTKTLGDEIIKLRLPSDTDTIDSTSTIRMTLNEVNELKNITIKEISNDTEGEQPRNRLITLTELNENASVDRFYPTRIFFNPYIGVRLNLNKEEKQSLEVVLVDEYEKERFLGILLGNEECTLNELGFLVFDHDRILIKFNSYIESNVNKPAINNIHKKYFPNIIVWINELAEDILKKEPNKNTSIDESYSNLNQLKGTFIYVLDNIPSYSALISRIQSDIESKKMKMKMKISEKQSRINQDTDKIDYEQIIKVLKTRNVGQRDVEQRDVGQRDVNTKIYENAYKPFERNKVYLGLPNFEHGKIRDDYIELQEKSMAPEQEPGKYGNQPYYTLFGIYKLKPTICSAFDLLTCKTYGSEETPIDNYIYQTHMKESLVRSGVKVLTIDNNNEYKNTKEYGGRKKTHKLKRFNHKKRTQIHRRKYKNTNCSKFIRTCKMYKRLYRSK